MADGGYSILRNTSYSTFY